MRTQVCHLRHEPLPCNVQGPFRYRLLGVLATVVLETPKHLHWLIPWEWSTLEVLLSKELDLCRRHHTPSTSHSQRRLSEDHQQGSQELMWKTRVWGNQCHSRQFLDRVAS